jgi:hypothetical protein
MLDILLSLPPNEDDVDVRFEGSAESDLDRTLAINPSAEGKDTRRPKWSKSAWLKEAGPGPGYLPADVRSTLVIFI